ncbi:MAG: hypothetical protein RLY16_2558 [Bacteroidota bacterium]|jgi:gluconate 5-dehydrogenase
MVKTFNLTQKVILVSGGYGHLGSAITESLCFHGATVYVLARTEEKFLAAFANLEVNRERLHFQQCDIASTASIQEAFQAVSKKEGRIDVLINNAFYAKGQSPETMADEDFEYCLDGTLSSVFRCIREIIPFFKQHGAGKIINVSSMYGMIAPDFGIYDEFPQYLNPPHYGAAKAGVIQLTKYYASYLGKDNITVNAVTPGPFPSQPIQQQTGFVHALAEKTCLKRIGLPEDLAGAFVFLAADAANFVTGQNIVVDGGWTTK